MDEPTGLTSSMQNEHQSSTETVKTAETAETAKADASRKFCDRIDKPILLHSLVTSVVLIAALSAATLLNSYAESVGFQWAQKLKDIEPPTATTATVSPVILGNLQASDTRLKRVQGQLQEIQLRANAHLKVMSYFYARYYMAICLASVFSLIAGTCLFFISRAGWDSKNERGASPYIINVFIVSSGIAVFLGAMPLMLKLEQNVSDNKSLYLRYVALDNEVLSYLITGETINKEKVDINSFIHYLDQQLAETNQLAIGFDSTAIPKAQDIYRDAPK